MLSICTTIKNRSRVEVENHLLPLFPNCVASLRKATQSGFECELVVTDWHSDDWPLSEWLADWCQQLTARVVPMEGSFCRGRGRNAAAEHARGDYLFFLDADCLVSRTSLEAGMQAVTKGMSYFPIVFSFSDPSHAAGWWRSEGFGNCMVPRHVFEQSGGWPEYQTWGREDDDFYARVQACSSVVRENAPGFFHQWHPERIDWKDRFRVDEEIQRVRRTLSELWNAVPIGETLILVDDGRFGGHERVTGRTVLPFVEREGVFWGPPADDEAAIMEFDRLRRKGARFLAIAWVGFWWLQYYTEFAALIRRRYRCCFESESLIVFDLQGGRSR